MKNIHLYIIISIFTLGLISCGDNMEFSNVHVLTDEEKAEIARQDSIEEAQKNKINADLILEYTSEITISQSLYDGVAVDVEIEKIAELFGISEAEVLAGIAGESDAPEVKGFAIEGTTHADFSSATNTNAPWGHWWDANGDVTEWGDDAMLFAEFDVESGVFNVGQYPAHLEDGQQVKFIEALKYDEKRVAVAITINANSPEQTSATIVGEQDLSIEVAPKSSYDTDSLLFDLDKTLSDLDVNSIEDFSFIGVNPDGSYNQEPVTGNGFWYNGEGFVGTYGEDGVLFTNYGDYSDNYISIGQYPDTLTAGQSITIKYGILANDKIEMLNITIEVVGYKDPETVPAGDPESVSIDIELSKAYSDDYASVNYDVKETLRNAFKMTTYQIHSAIASEELKLYVNEVSEDEPAYTADAPGYWINADGNVCEWGEGVIWCSLGHSETELYIYGGNHPENAVAGTTINSTLIATCNDGSVTMNVTFILE